VGAVPNRALLREAAWAGRGVEVLIEQEQDLARASERLRRATGQPVLTQLSIEGAGVAAKAEGGLHDVFAQQPLTVAIELSHAGGPVTLKGRIAGTTDAWTHTFTVPPADEVVAEKRSPLPLGALFGREQVGALEVQAAVWGPRQEGRKPLEDRIEATALRHRIVSSRTSLVAISEEPAVDPQDPVRRVRLAVEMPAGVSAAAVGLSSVACSMPVYNSRHAVVLSNATSTPNWSSGMLLEHRASKAPFAEKECFGGWDPDDDSLDPHTQGWTNVSPLEIQPLSVACVGPKSCSRPWSRTASGWRGRCASIRLRMIACRFSATLRLPVTATSRRAACSSCVPRGLTAWFLAPSRDWCSSSRMRSGHVRDTCSSTLLA
jgi:hypothetical protein